MDQIEATATSIVTAEQARMYNLRFGQAGILVDGECSGGRCWVGVFRLDPGFATPFHLHHKTDEHLFVIDGVLSLYVGDQWHDLRTGSLAVVPHGTPHAQCNAGTQPVRILGSGEPAGFERFFAAQHELLARLSLSDPQFYAEMTKTLSECDTQVIGPPPSRT
jgi:uncharacterized cupin superfamily protein